MITQKDFYALANKERGVPLEDVPFVIWEIPKSTNPQYTFPVLYDSQQTGDCQQVEPRTGDELVFKLSHNHPKVLAGEVTKGVWCCDVVASPDLNFLKVFYVHPKSLIEDRS